MVSVRVEEDGEAEAVDGEDFKETIVLKKIGNRVQNPLSNI